mmetsp:Transcript_85668/g.134642  ORF Transcript_85668/g.134642 Transcript_85668/m.134642 type:complete len:450 (-) Transcript_85668:57-1406(-)
MHHTPEGAVAAKKDCEVPLTSADMMVVQLRSSLYMVCLQLRDTHRRNELLEKRCAQYLSQIQAGQSTSKTSVVDAASITGDFPKMPLSSQTDAPPSHIINSGQLASRLHVASTTQNTVSVSEMPLSSKPSFALESNPPAQVHERASLKAPLNSSSCKIEPELRLPKECLHGSISEMIMSVQSRAIVDFEMREETDANTPRALSTTSRRGTNEQTDIVSVDRSAIAENSSIGRVRTEDAPEIRLSADTKADASQDFPTLTAEALAAIEKGTRGRLSSQQKKQLKQLVVPQQKNNRGRLSSTQRSVTFGADDVVEVPSPHSPSASSGSEIFEPLTAAEIKALQRQFYDARHQIANDAGDRDTISTTSDGPSYRHHPWITGDLERASEAPSAFSQGRRTAFSISSRISGASTRSTSKQRLAPGMAKGDIPPRRLTLFSNRSSLASRASSHRK